MEKKKKKINWMNVVRVLITGAALTFLFLTVDLREVLAKLRDAKLLYLGAAFLLYILSLVMRAYRWFALLQALDPEVPFGRLLRLYFVGQFFSSFLPSGYGGDVVRALELTQDTDSSAAVGTVLLDRASGLLVNFAIGLIMLPFVAATMELWLVAVLIVVAGGGLIAGALVLEGRLLRRMTGWLPAKISLSGEGPLAKVYAAVTNCGWPAILRALGVSVVFNITNVVINWLCGQALDIGVGLAYFFVVTPLLSVSTLFPSIGGWGIRENVARAVFAPTGAADEVSTALSASIGLVNLAAGLVGGGVHGIGMLSNLVKRAEEPQPGQPDTPNGP
jgi:uncharacterized membrane protein YbhN (UPF0104 family)